MCNRCCNVWVTVCHSHPARRVIWQPCHVMPCHAMLCPAGVVPQGEAAVNWRVAVYWSDDQTFFESTVTGYLEESGEHEVRKMAKGEGRRGRWGITKSTVEGGPDASRGPHETCSRACWAQFKGSAVLILAVVFLQWS